MNMQEIDSSPMRAVGTEADRSEPALRPQLPSCFVAEASRELLAQVARARGMAEARELESGAVALRALSALYTPGIAPVDGKIAADCVKSLQCGLENLSGARFAPGAREIFCLSGDGRAEALPLAGGDPRSLTLPGPEGEAKVAAARMLSDRHALTASSGGEVAIQDLSEGKTCFKYRVDGKFVDAAIAPDGRSLALSYCAHVYLDEHLFRYGIRPKPMRDGTGTLDVFVIRETMYGERWCRTASYSSRYGLDHLLRAPVLSGDQVLIACAGALYKLEIDERNGSRVMEREPYKRLPAQVIETIGAGPGGSLALGCRSGRAALYCAASPDGWIRGDCGGAAPSIAFAPSAAEVAFGFGDGTVEVRSLDRQGDDGAPLLRARAALPGGVGALSYDTSSKALLAVAGSGRVFALFEHPEHLPR